MDGGSSVLSVSALVPYMHSLVCSAIQFCHDCQWLWLWLVLANVTFARGEERSLALKEVVRQSFAATHDGWSSDEVLVQEALNQAFLQACRQRLPGVADRDFNWTLLNLRKAKQLGATVTRRRPAKHDAYRHAAEIAARLLEDQHRQNIDRVLCDPALREQFDKVAQEMAPKTSAYLLRKAALGLRKSRRLQPELVVRVADWQRSVQTFWLPELTGDLKQLPEQPGVYLLMDGSGYLYIGEAANLRQRLTEHLRHSDRPTLAKYLAEQSESDSPREANPIRVEIHAFKKKSPAEKVSLRRAYESELIRSRQPRFNIRP